MKQFLIQRWFLIVLLACVTASILWPGPIERLTQAWEPRLVISAALFLMAWTMPTAQLHQELRQPWATLWAVAISYGIVPAMAWLLGFIAPLPDIGIGLLLSASVPCTLASAVLWTRLGGGNEATALLTVVLSTLTSWIFTPFWLTYLTSIAVDAGELQTQMMLDLVLFLIVPVLIGQALRWPRLGREFATRHKGFLGILAQFFIVSIVLKASSSVGGKLAEEGERFGPDLLLLSIGLAVGLHLLALAGGFWTSRWWGFDRPRQIAVAIACSQKTLPVSLFLFDKYFKTAYPMAVVPLLFYHVGQLVLDTFIADRLKRSAPDLHSRTGSVS